MTVYYSPILDMIFVMEVRDNGRERYTYSSECLFFSDYDKDLIKKLQLKRIGEL